MSKHSGEKRHKYFERILEGTNNNLAAKLTPQEKKIKSQVTYKRRFVPVQKQSGVCLSKFNEIGHHFSRVYLRI